MGKMSLGDGPRKALSKGHRLYGNYLGWFPPYPIFSVLHFWICPLFSLLFQGSDVCWTWDEHLELNHIYKTPTWPGGGKPLFWWFIPRHRSRMLISYPFWYPSLLFLFCPWLLFTFCYFPPLTGGTFGPNVFYSSVSQPWLHIIITWGTLKIIPMPELYSKAITSVSLPVGPGKALPMILIGSQV